MSRRLCPECGGPMEAETIGREPGRVVAYCGDCRLVVEPSDATVAGNAVAPSVPTSSADRMESEGRP